jgi:subtilisin family serine protease
MYRGWPSRRAAFLAGAFVALTTLPAGELGAGGKISGELRFHQRQKARLAASMQDAAAWSEEPLSSTELHAERCALYVRRRLTAAEIAALAEQGISASSWAWVPPVPGRHPFGFHLARVRYSSLELIERDERFTRLESVELEGEWLNDLAGAMIRTPAVHRGDGVPRRSGAGIRIAIADTGLDLAHADLPAPVEAFDVTRGDSPASWSMAVPDLLLGHGTHVTGTAVGNGSLSGGLYRGAAPDAILHFYKIGSFSLAMDDAIKSVIRAREAGCDVFSGSWGFWTTHLDGSDSLCQAVDAAVAAGMICFLAAGNAALDAAHASLEAPAGALSPAISITVDNVLGQRPYTVDEHIRVIWRDGPAEGELELEAAGLGLDEALSWELASSSERGTRGQLYRLVPSIPPGEQRTYRLALRNASPSAAPAVHLYRVRGKGRFEPADPRFTVTSPALADSAIAVGAWTSRDRFVNALGELVDASSRLTIGARAPFSSLGPRLDGRMKPDFVAPGALTISCLDSVALGLRVPAARELFSEVEGYAAFSGTSMATPLAAGAAALLLEEAPVLTPLQVKLALKETAAAAGASRDEAGHGLIDVLAAVRRVAAGGVTDCQPAAGAADGDQDGIPDECESRPVFLRGDCNGDGAPVVHVTDAIILLAYNFAGGARPPCLAACDVNGDGAVEGQIFDAVHILAFTFAGGPPPVAPFPRCGAGMLATDRLLGCEAPPPCR